MMNLTRYRQLIMQAVERGDVLAMYEQRQLTVHFMRRADVDAEALSLPIKVDGAATKALRMLWSAGLVRLSRAGHKHGAWTTRTVLCTAAGRRWLTGVACKTRRGTSNGNARGGSAERRRRKQWLLDQFGDGITAQCSLKLIGCEQVVTIETISVDRIVPGCEGGTYRRDNIQPACGPCNSKHGGQLGNQRKGT